MKSNAPWSVKGIEKDAREAAKEAARREGMTVGEWLSHVIVTAGDPEAQHGEIEGLKLADLVTAIEHLNRRIASTETKSLAALDELARNFGGVVDRVQRLERARQGADGAPADIEERIARLEERTNDRQKIDSLKALERAIGQIALQFDAGQKGQAQRLESTERQIQELASRIDSALDAGSSAGAIDYLKDTIDGLSARIARTERLAAEASRQKPHMTSENAADAEFVERTGARLRVLGDEIKRGGDQIRAFESMMRKLSDQIDAAERRSSEGVQKVAETIADLRVQLVQTEGAEAAATRQETEIMVAELSQRTEDRFEALQQSIDALCARFDAGFSTAEASQGAAAQADPEDAADLQDVADDAFEFDDEDAPEISTASDAADVLKEVEDAFAGRAHPSAAAMQDDDVDGIDAILAELDSLSESSDPEAPAQPPLVKADMVDGDLDVTEADESGAEDGPDKADFLAEARRAAKEAAAKEAAERAAAESGLPQRRKLTPKQRAILAAKIKRKRLAEQGLATDDAPPTVPPLPDPAPTAPSAAEARETKASLFAGLVAKLGGLRSKTPEKQQGEPDVTKRESDNPNLARGAMNAAATLTTKPVTLALGVAILLAAVAVFFLVKDLMFGGAPKDEKPSAAVAGPTPVAPQLKEDVVPPPPTLTQPRTLYLDAVAKLRVATSETDTRAALTALEQAAALGHPPAQLQLGELYKLGQGVPQDLAQARAWYERAANGGNVLAMHRVGVMAARGQGGPADQTKAIAWFEKAAGLGLLDSQYNLGAIFHPGGDGAQFGNQNAGKAYFWYTLASRNGDEQAGSLASGLAAGLSGDERARLDADVAAFAAGTPDPDANEIAPAS